MNAILLCAGFGTRMYPLTVQTAKALLPIGNKVVLDIIIEHIISLEVIEDIHLVTNNRFFYQFRQWQTNWSETLSKLGIRLLLYNDGVDQNENRLGAVGDLGFVLEKGGLWDHPALVMAGDNLFLFSFQPVLKRFFESGKDTVIALTEEDPDRLRRTGVIEIGRDGKITKFEEKPAKPFSNLFCPPAYFLTSPTIGLVSSYLRAQENKDAIGSFIKYLVELSNVIAVEVDGVRLDIGSLGDYSIVKYKFSD